MSGYTEWDVRNDVSFFLELVRQDGVGLTGSLALIAIKRVRRVSGSFLDGYYWNSASFVSAPTFLTMSEIDKANQPGLYTYCFSESLVQQENIYSVYYRHDTDPIGFAQETHFFTVPKETFYVNLPDTGSMHFYEAEPEGDC